MTSRKQPGVAFWATVVVVVVLLYPLGTGPAIWLNSRGLLPEWGRKSYVVFYAPILWAADESPTVLRAYMWYTDFWRATPVPGPV